jgi:hypothetical protein
MFHITQWTQVPRGASGSSTIRAMDLDFSGMLSKESGGLTSAPSQVYLDGIIPLWENAGLVIDNSLIFLSSPDSLRY